MFNSRISSDRRTIGLSLHRCSWLVVIVVASLALFIALGGVGFAATVAAEEGRSIEVIDLRSISPLDTATVLASLAKTHRAVIVDEGAGKPVSPTSPWASGPAPNPPPRRGTSTSTLFIPMPSTLAAVRCTCVGPCVDENIFTLSCSVG